MGSSAVHSLTANQSAFTMEVCTEKKASHCDQTRPDKHTLDQIRLLQTYNMYRMIV